MDADIKELYETLDYRIADPGFLEPGEAGCFPAMPSDRDEVRARGWS